MKAKVNRIYNKLEGVRTDRDWVIYLDDKRYLYYINGAVELREGTPPEGTVKSLFNPPYEYYLNNQEEIKALVLNYAKNRDRPLFIYPESYYSKGGYYEQNILN